MNLRTGIIIVSIAGLLIASAGLVAAQTDTSQPQTEQAADPTPMPGGFGWQLGGRGGPHGGGHGGFGPQGFDGFGGRGPGAGMGFRQGGPRGFSDRGGPGLIGHLAEGTTLTATFYDGNPEEGAAELNTLSITIGQDSEMSFAKSLREAMQTAAFVKINTSAQSRTLELGSTDPLFGPRPGMAGFFLGNMSVGSSVEALFYNADPATGAVAATSLTFVAGEDSEIAFRNAFAEAAASASYVTIHTSAQEWIIDLSQIRQKWNPQGTGLTVPQTPQENL